LKENLKAFNKDESITKKCGASDSDTPVDYSLLDYTPNIAITGKDY